ncbi:hypothetical protein BaRGS_00034471 [Batillaria attramentaria]|uniref:Uncharacterized protein n=1 Tax=Batillaria attramentaria TaxID=370345 RepID=A0ABD0JH09_9CAEN
MVGQTVEQYLWQKINQNPGAVLAANGQCFFVWWATRPSWIQQNRLQRSLKWPGENGDSPQGFLDHSFWPEQRWSPVRSEP